MTPLESIFYMIWRGIAVGVLISAPMGPVGILCIQRTLDKGRHAGFYTGVGAAISDMFYCLLTGFGLSFIEDFIESNQNVIQLIGSIVLIAFSIYLFRKDPSSPLRRPVPQNVSARKNILGGFLFTFSNPLIIFLIIGLFARFNFTAPDIKAPYIAIGYLFIAAGALGWWYGITYAINKVRSRFNMRSMKIMNVGIGIVILGFACVGIVTSIMGMTSADAKAAPPTHTIYFGSAEHPDTLAPGERLTIDTRGTDRLQLDFKLRSDAGKASLSGHPTPPWEIAIAGADRPDTLRIRIGVAEYAPTPLSSQPAMTCHASSTGGFSASSPRPLTDGLALPAGWNHYRLTADPAAGIILMAGERQLQPLLEIDSRELPARFASIEIINTPEAPALTRDVRLSLPPIPPRAEIQIDDALQRADLSSDPIEGIWEILDWSLNTALARQGGQYRLAIVRRSDGSYDMIYLDGADTLKGEWQPGMVKGRLRPTGTAYIYDLTWIDAEGRMMERNLRAQALPLQNMMTLNFPFLETTIRLHKTE